MHISFMKKYYSTDNEILFKMRMNILWYFVKKGVYIAQADI